MMRRWTRAQVLLWTTLGLVACGGEDGAGAVAEAKDAAAPDGVGGGPGGDVGPTWSQDVAPLLARHCTVCHTAGGAGPFPLDDYDSTRTVARSALSAMRAGRMPPWLPDPACRHYRHERLMADVEKDLFEAWLEGGMPLGDGPARIEQPQAESLGVPDAQGQPTEPYVPSTERPDDYRCLPLDVTFEQDTFVRGTQVVPGDRAIVHHVLVFVVPPDQVAELERKDAAEEGPGYTCFGGSGLGSAGPFAAWVPGSQPVIRAEGYASFVPAGSRLVIQVHYNLLAADPSPDLTRVQMTFWDRPQANIVQSHPQPNLQIRIPAGEPASTHVREFVNRGEGPLSVIGVAPHMHLLGERIRVDVARADGSDECLIDIPRWDFHWQQSYELEEPVVVQPGEAFRLTCEYDNSAANQPVVNGERLTPRDVTWGEGTLDEMCLNYVILAEPYVAGAARTCGRLDACRGSCADPNDFGCVGDCMTADEACARCAVAAVTGVGGCAREACLPELAAAGDCFRACIVDAITGGGLGACLEAMCPDESRALNACMGPVLAAGACDAQIESCTAQ